MNKKRIISIMLLVIFILSSMLPTINVVNAATNETITLNSSLYKAVKAELETKGIYATYNDAQYTMTLSQDAINSITELNLSNNEISDITGLDKFVNVTSVDLSANELTKESNLEVLNSFNLKFLDLSSNEISDVSAITGINNIETVNLHNQKFNEAVIISNSVVKEGTYTVDCQLPQVIRDFAKPIKSGWLNDTYLPQGTDVKFDWSSFNSSSDSVKLKIGNTSGTFNGLATLKVKIDDMSNKLYNSEINLYYVVVDEDQRGIAIKDRNLYEAIKENLGPVDSNGNAAKQTINSNLSNYNTTTRLYDAAYDEQMIFVIDLNVLINKIKSLVLDNKRIEDLSGIEMFVGLEKELNVSSNYIDTIDRIVDLQKMKDTEEAALQARFKEIAQQISERVTKLESLETELQTVVKAYNEAVGKYNSYVASDDQTKTEKMLEQLEVIKTNGKRYIQLTGMTLTIFGTEYNAKSIDNLTQAINQDINEVDAESYKSVMAVVNAYNGYVAKNNSWYNYDSSNNYIASEMDLIMPYIKQYAKQYIRLTKNSVTIYGVQYNIQNISSIDNIVTNVQLIPEINTHGVGEIVNAQNNVLNKLKTIYDVYNNTYKVTSVITPELKNITDEEYNNLNLEGAKSLLQAQVTKIGTIEKNFTEKEKAYLRSQFGIVFGEENNPTPVATYFAELLKNLEENKDVSQYKTTLYQLRVFDAYVTSGNKCLISNYINENNTCNASLEEIGFKEEDGENTAYLYDGLNVHKNGCTYKNNVSEEDMLAIAGRIAKATDADIAAYVVLPRLRSLNMNENLIENIDEISIMKELRTLDMGQNEIVNINNVNWSAMPKIHTLNLSFNNISEIKALEILKNLKSLDLSRNLISGSLDFTISDMKKLQSLNLSSNQIDDIEYLKAQYEFIAKDKGVEVGDLIVPIVNLQGQELSLEATVEQSTSLMKIELPKIFSQVEELQWEETTFGINSLYGNVTSDGKYVSLDISTAGTKNASVTILSADLTSQLSIASGTRCSIIYKVVEEFDRTLPEVTFGTNGGTYTLTDGNAKIATVVNVTDNSQVVSAEYVWATSNVEKQTEYVAMENIAGQEISMDVTEAGTWYLWVKATDDSGNVVEQCSEAFVVNAPATDSSEIVITINTNDGSSVKEIKEVNSTNYILVSKDTTVSQVLSDISLNTEDYNLVVKDASLENTITETETLKTNLSVVIEGLEDKAKCVIVVKGDANGDGAIDMSDILKLNECRNEKVELTDAEFLAGNVENTNEEIDMSDILKINEYKNNKIDSL